MSAVMGMEMVSVYIGMQKARRWNKEKINYLPGAYAVALRNIYGEKYVHIDVKANRKLLDSRKSGYVVHYHTELV